MLNSIVGRFNLKTVLSLAEQMVSRLEYFHSKNFVHRDLKPDNFLMGLGAQAHIVYLVDYGLAKVCIRTPVPAPVALLVSG